jgi:hypothetical protein
MRTAAAALPIGRLELVVLKRWPERDKFTPLCFPCENCRGGHRETSSLLSYEPLVGRKIELGHGTRCLLIAGSACQTK